MINLTSTTDPQYEQYTCYPGGGSASCHGSSHCSDIAVIVTAHNSSAFLKDCLDSILAQSLPPEKIVIVDDHSKQDNTLAIAHAYEQHGCHVLRTPENLGMCGARMHGLAQTTSPVIMFFDGDDVMPPDYLKTMRAELGSNGFVYPGRKFFGAMQGSSPAPEADRAKLWSQNYCPSPSLMWRHVFEAAGGWQKPNAEGTLPDWDLFLRMSGIAPFAPSKASVMVRKHASNYSGNKWSRHMADIMGDTREHAAKLTVGIVYSGRLPGSLGAVLKCAANSAQAAGKTPSLRIIDDSMDGLDALACHATVANGSGFGDIEISRIHRDRSKKLLPHEVSRMLAGAYNTMLRFAPGDLLWMIEDDILVPVNACRDLMDTILRSKTAPMPAACGCYRSRHDPRRFILSSCRDGAVVHSFSPPATPSPVQLTGTGCLMVLRDLVSEMAFRPQWCRGNIRSNAHDWTLSGDLWDQGRPVIALPTVVCPHLQDDHAFV